MSREESTNISGVQPPRPAGLNTGLPGAGLCARVLCIVTHCAAAGRRTLDTSNWASAGFQGRGARHLTGSLSVSQVWACLCALQQQWTVCDSRLEKFGRLVRSAAGVDSEATFAPATSTCEPGHKNDQSCVVSCPPNISRPRQAFSSGQETLSPRSTASTLPPPLFPPFLPGHGGDGPVFRLSSRARVKTWKSHNLR